jgi:hypothetical protein
VISTIPLSALQATAAKVSKDRVRECLSGVRFKTPVVARAGDKYRILEGHEELFALHLRGEQEADVVIVETNGHKTIEGKEAGEGVNAPPGGFQPDPEGPAASDWEADRFAVAADVCSPEAAGAGLPGETQVV